MEDALHRRIALRHALALVLLVLVAAPASAWGPVAHAAVLGRALDTLPGGLKPFYKNHRLEIPTLAVDAPPPTEEFSSALSFLASNLAR